MLIIVLSIGLRKHGLGNANARPAISLAKAGSGVLVHFFPVKASNVEF
jgi:hypothetical protein